MKKVLSLILSASMLFAICALFAFPAAAETPCESVETAQNAAKEASKPVINERFDGETIRFFVNGGEGSTLVRSIVIGEEDDPDYEVNRRITARNEKVENELGVTIELTETKGMQETYGYLRPILASKIYAYDVYALYQFFDLGLALGGTAGSFYNYLNMPLGSYLNVDAAYWNKALFETLSCNNSAYFITGDLCLGNAGTMFVSYVNATMWDRYKDEIAHLTNNPEGYTSVYDIVKNGYWTMDLWCELSAMPYMDVNRNDQIDYEDTLGLIVYNEQLNCIMTDMFAAGAGVTYSKRDPDGTPSIAIDTPYNLAFLEKLYTLLCESKAARIPWLNGDDDDIYIMEIFAQGNVLLTVNTLACAEEYLADMTDNYYIMPLPMFDRAQFDENSPSLGYKTQLGDSVSQYAIAAAAGDDRIPAITATMELMAYYSMTDVTPAVYDEALKGRYIGSQADAEIIDLIRAGIYADFATVWSNKLDNVTWFARTNYAQYYKFKRILRQQQDSKALALARFLPDLTYAFYCENAVPPTVLYGDIRSDGYVNKKDSLALRHYLADNAYAINKDAADVYRDGFINKKDSLHLKQFLAGWDVLLGTPKHCAHLFETKTIPPTCTEAGYDIHICRICGYIYSYDLLPPHHDYVDGVCTLCGAKENGEPEFGTQAWLDWLVYVDGEREYYSTYLKCLGGGVYPCGHDGAEEGSPFEVWGPVDNKHFHMTYQLDSTEIDATAKIGTEDYEYIFEIWYRDATADGDYKRVVTAPWSAYIWGGDNTNVIYRIPVYNEGMNDMRLLPGETSHDYEMILIVYHGDEISPENLVAWKHDWIPYTDATEMYIADASELGIISSTHTVVVDPAVAPTCTQTGLTAGTHCSQCGAILRPQTVIPATGHQYENGKCTVCGYECTHTAVTDPAVAPTCTRAGLTAGTHCSQCGAILTPQTVIPSAGGHQYVNGKCTVCGASENGEPAFGTQEWLDWLINVDALLYDDAMYKMCLGGSVYNRGHEGAEVSSPFEVWPNPDYSYNDPHFHMTYQLDSTEIDATANVNTEDYEFIWEIWYRDADKMGEFKKIVTAPWSVYIWGGDNPNVIYRIPVYNEGMNDMRLLPGETSHEYEMIFIIYKGDTVCPENLVAWKQDWILYTDATEMYIEDAKELGIID